MYYLVFYKFYRFFKKIYTIIKVILSFFRIVFLKKNKTWYKSKNITKETKLTTTLLSSARSHTRCISFTTLHSKKVCTRVLQKIIHIFIKRLTILWDIQEGLSKKGDERKLYIFIKSVPMGKIHTVIYTNINKILCINLNTFVLLCDKNKYWYYLKLSLKWDRHVLPYWLCKLY